MGVDIYTRSGILFTVDEAVRFFKGLSKEEIKSFVEANKSEFCGANGCDSELTEVKTLSDLKSWFVNLANSKVVKDDDYISDTSALERVWMELAGGRLDLPEVSFEYFSSNRYSGYDVPTQTVCLVFNDNDLFETKPTKSGKQVAKKLGIKAKDFKTTTWTVYSY